MSKPLEDAPPQVSIILLNYGGAEDTLACLASLAHLTYPAYSIVVVDNASPDNSVKRLLMARQMEEVPNFHLIPAEENLGYSGGNNLGIRYALERGADFIWLLNNDTTVEPTALSHLVDEGKRTGGLVGSLVLYPDRSYQRVGTEIHWQTGGVRGIPEDSLENGMEIECLTGASLLVPARAFLRVGLLDESYFLYFEDNEFTLRAREAGYIATLALRSRVYHKEGATTGKHSLRTQYYYHRNRLKMLFQFASRSEKTSIALYTGYRLLREHVKALFKAELKPHARTQWLAVRDFYRGVEGPCPHGLS